MLFFIKQNITIRREALNVEGFLTLMLNTFCLNSPLRSIVYFLVRKMCMTSQQATSILTRGFAICFSPGFHITWFELSSSMSVIRHSVKKKFVKLRHKSRLSKRSEWLFWLSKFRLYAVYNVSVLACSGWRNHTLYSTAKTLKGWKALDWVFWSFAGLASNTNKIDPRVRKHMQWNVIDNNSFFLYKCRKKR